MEGLYAVVTGIAVWFGLLQLWRATRYKAAYNELICNPPPEESCAGDLNGDTFVDDADFVLFAQAYENLVCP